MAARGSVCDFRVCPALLVHSNCLNCYLPVTLPLLRCHLNIKESDGVACTTVDALGFLCATRVTNWYHKVKTLALALRVETIDDAEAPAHCFNVNYVDRRLRAEGRVGGAEEETDLYGGKMRGRGRKPQDIRHVQEAEPVSEPLSLTTSPRLRLPPRSSDHIPLKPPCSRAPLREACRRINYL
ncbi:hypothetical protein K1T71_005117 [Dendrolimus kikuchii]|uniref:Uncharacterized protein n=1 Tax=Dendrolimus kikuchii TaxID=765133 RepID=A0ACC1D6H4_9NEOP|nr:hypothetical protein K1T71_005117 [Dendrolimus kikuchii]